MTIINTYVINMKPSLFRMALNVLNDSEFYVSKEVLETDHNVLSKICF